MNSGVIQLRGDGVIEGMTSARLIQSEIARPFLAATMMMMATACSPAGVLNLTSPRAGIEISRDIAYGDKPRQKLDVYAPRSASSGGGNAPVVVFFYGGGWTEGDRKQYGFVARALASRGIVVVVPDYRLYPEVRFPAFIEDAAAATRWAHDHVRSHGGDPRRLFVVGHSAGAYIATMLSLDPRYLGTVGLDPGHDLAGCVGLAGPYDFLPLGTDELRAIFGTGEALVQTQPVNFVSAKAPPMLLITGKRDDTVYPRNSIRLAARLREAGARVQTIIYPRVGHRLLIGAFARPLRLLAPVLNDVSRFVILGPGDKT
jgi:acetyl esterase/lipase